MNSPEPSDPRGHPVGRRHAEHARHHPPQPRSRRGLLLAGVAGVAALVAILLFVLPSTGARHERTLIQFLFVGDSPTLGEGVEPRQNFPSQALDLLSQPLTLMETRAVPDATTTSALAGAATDVDPRFNDSASKHALFVWLGSNDLALGAGWEEVYANLRKYCDERRARGFRVVVFTLLPRRIKGDRDAFEKGRIQLNYRIREFYGEFANAVADVALQREIGDAGAEANPMYYQGDGVHLTAAGCGVVAKELERVVLNLESN